MRTTTPPQPPDPLHLARIASGGASRSQIYAWLNEDLSDESQKVKEETRGADPKLNEDQVMLLLGFAVSERSSLKPVSLQSLQLFTESHLGKKLSYSTLSRIMSEHGFSSQKTMVRNSRMISPEVVDDALSLIEEIRSYKFPPNRIICMDETGLWSNVAQPKTYHFKNWCVIDELYEWCQFLPICRWVPHLSNSLSQ